MGKKKIIYKEHNKPNHWILEGFSDYVTDAEIALLKCPICNETVYFDCDNECFEYCPYCANKINTKLVLIPKEKDNKKIYITRDYIV